MEHAPDDLLVREGLPASEKIGTVRSSSRSIDTFRNSPLILPDGFEAFEGNVELESKRRISLKLE